MRDTCGLHVSSKVIKILYMLGYMQDTYEVHEDTCQANMRDTYLWLRGEGMHRCHRVKRALEALACNGKHFLRCTMEGYPDVSHIYPFIHLS
jgi:hypothetical protein